MKLENPLAIFKNDIDIEGMSFIYISKLRWDLYQLLKNYSIMMIQLSEEQTQLNNCLLESARLNLSILEPIMGKENEIAVVYSRNEVARDTEFYFLMKTDFNRIEKMIVINNILSS